MPGNRRPWGFTVSEDLNPHSGEISPDLGLNSKTSEKSPDRGVHAAMVAGAACLASTRRRQPTRDPGLPVCGQSKPDRRLTCLLPPPRGLGANNPTPAKLGRGVS
jgi:hypothetical protein